jgi:hypothetical protein
MMLAQQLRSKGRVTGDYADQFNARVQDEALLLSIAPGQRPPAADPTSIAGSGTVTKVLVPLCYSDPTTLLFRVLINEPRSATPGGISRVEIGILVEPQYLFGLPAQSNNLNQCSNSACFRVRP